MSEVIWKTIDDLKPDLQPPNKVLENLSEGLYDATSGLVDFKIEEVKYFPEEVTYSVKAANPAFSALQGLGSKTVKDPHPDFGYDTSEGRNVAFRYRYILIVADQPSIKAEIFKFKFPVAFYPVKFFIDKDNFRDLEEYYEDEELTTPNEELFKEICLKIFQSQEFVRIIKRFSAIGA